MIFYGTTLIFSEFSPYFSCNLGSTGFSAQFVNKAVVCIPASKIRLLSYKNGVGSTVPGGASSIKRLIVTVFWSINISSWSFPEANAFANVWSSIFAESSLIASAAALSRMDATMYGPKNAAGITTLSCLAAKLPTFFKPYKSPINAGLPAAAPPNVAER